MTTFKPIGTNEALESLAAQLKRHGATESAEDPMLVLVAAPDTIPSGFANALSPALWRRAVVVGLDREGLDDRGPDSLNDFLEATRPLGVISREAIERWGAPMFLGPKKLAHSVDAAALKGVATDSYAAWITEDEDAGGLLIRLAAAAR